jgi:uracil-DNA glycosylase family 4
MPKVGEVRKGLPILPPWEQHFEDWKDCKRCPLHQHRHFVVLARGNLPCDILFIGEAPGFNEDAVGLPLVGPAGQHLEKIINRAIAPEGILTRSCAFTNLVCCIPKDPESSHSKVEEPEHDDILACQPRLLELIEMAQPKLVVLLGKVAKTYVEGGEYKTNRYSLKLPPHVKIIEMMHPAFILRSNIANRELLTQRCVVQLANAADDLDKVPEWGESKVTQPVQKKINTIGRKGLFRTLADELPDPPQSERPVWDSDDIPF